MAPAPEVSKLPKLVGVIPKMETKKPMSLEHKQHRADARNLIKSFFDRDTVEIKWKVLDIRGTDDTNFEFNRARMEQVAATMIHIGFQEAKIFSPYKLGYSHVVWIGADNLCVTTHYFHHLARMCGIKTMTINNGNLNLEEIVDAVYRRFIVITDEYGRTHFRNVFVVFCNAVTYEGPGSLWEIQPFVPKDEKLLKEVDFMIMKSAEQSDVSLLKLESLTRFTLNSSRKETKSKTANILQELLNQHKVYLESNIQLAHLLTMLYPHHISKNILNSVINYHWRSVLKKQALKFLEVLKSNNLVFEIEDVPGFPVYFVSKRLQEDFATLWTTKLESGCEFMKATVENMEIRLNEYFESVSAIVVKKNLGILSSVDFQRIKLLVSEIVMQQSWFRSTPRLDGRPAPFAMRLTDKVIDYVNTNAFEHINICHRQEPLGTGNSVVRKGFIRPRPRKGLEEKVAVKCILNDKWKSLDRETDSLLKLNSPHIVRYYQQVWTPEFTYIVMEQCDQTLEQWVLKQGMKNFHLDLHEHDLSQRFKFLHDVNNGLDYLHDYKIRHRDIKPSNILLKTEGTTTIAKLADFGLSKPVNNMTTSKSGVGGTLLYIAPEAISGSTTLATDMYSFGKVFYYVLTCGNDPPFPFVFDSLNFGSFDFYGVVDAVRALTATDPLERPTAKELLQYPMYWIAGEKERDQFANFIVNFTIDYGKEGTPLHDELMKIKLDWVQALKATYAGEDVEDVIYQGPSNSNAAKKPKKETTSLKGFRADAANYLPFVRNFLSHSTEHKAKGLQFAEDRYFDGDSITPNRWKFFVTYFRPFPSLFFQVWKIATDPKWKVPMDKLCISKSLQELKIN